MDNRRIRRHIEYLSGLLTRLLLASDHSGWRTRRHVWPARRECLLCEIATFILSVSFRLLYLRLSSFV